MPLSPVQFAHAFARLVAETKLAAYDAGRIDKLIAFVPELMTVAERDDFTSYVSEFVDLLTRSMTEDSISDLLPDELRFIESFLLLSIKRSISCNTLAEMLRSVQLRQAALAFFVGDFETGLRHMGDAVGKQVFVNCTPRESLDLYQSFMALCDSFESESEAANQAVLSIKQEWESFRDSFFADRIHCLLVERDTTGKIGRGRLRTLTGDVRETGQSGDDIDRLTFSHQLKSADDPGVGVVYDGLTAVKKLLSSLSHASTTPGLNARFAIIGNGSPVTGDSIGLASAILAYTQLLQPKVTRFEKFVSADTAATGSIDCDGNILPVNGQSLRQKLTRAFFSPLASVVLPEANAEAAREYIAELQRVYPRRVLHIIAVSHLRDVLTNRNVLRDEKMCLGALVGKQVRSYTMKTKVHMAASALIVVLIAWFLAIQINPKLSPWFDYHIASFEISSNVMIAYNSDNQELLRTRQYDMPLNLDSYNNEMREGYFSYYQIVDLDSDGKDEFVVFPRFNNNGGGHTVEVYVQDSAEYELPYCMPSDYWPDSVLSQYNFYGAFIITDSLKQKYFLLMAAASGPARFQFNLFDIKGRHISGPYVHQGTSWGKAPLILDINQDGWDEIIIGMVNNMYNRCAILVLNPFNLNGVSPSYDSPDFIISHAQKGSQLYYVAFPETPLSSTTECYCQPTQIRHDTASGGWEVYIQEGVGARISAKPDIIYTLDSLFVPIRSPYFGDGDYEVYLYGLQERTLPNTLDRAQLCDYLYDNFIIYKDSTIVYSPHDGINFYK